MKQDRLENWEMESSGKAESIVGDLKEQILEGKLPEKTKLPSERQLSDHYKVSRMTVRRALQALEGEGLVVRNRADGPLFVGADRDRLHQFQGSDSSTEFETLIMEGEELRKHRSFYKEVEATGRKPGTVWLEQPALVAPGPTIAEHLQLQDNVLVFKRYRLQLVDGLPYRIIKSFYPADLFGELLTTDIGNKPLFDWLQERHALVVSHAREELIARLATADERRSLQVSPTAPVVAINRKVWAESGRVVEWANIIAVAKRYSFTFEYYISRQKQENREES